MNFQNMKLPDGRCWVGLRLRIPENPVGVVAFSSPGLLTSMLLAEVLELNLGAAGLSGCRVAIGGEFCHCCGFLKLPDPDAALPVVMRALKKYGLVKEFVELFVFDPNEEIWRPLTPGAHAPFDLDQILAASDHAADLMDQALIAEREIARARRHDQALQDQ